MNRRSLVLLFILIITSALLSIGCDESSTGPEKGPGGYDVWYVDAGATGSGDGTSWEDAFAHPADAMDAAVSGDEIWIAAGTYYGAGDIYTPVISFKAGVEVYGGFLGDETSKWPREWRDNETVLCGGDTLNHVVTGADDALLHGCHVTRGNATGNVWTYDDRGGGIYCYDAKMRISNCEISNNRAEFGGGIYVELDTVVIDSCYIEYNEATSDGISYSGGGGANLLMTTALVHECSFYDNSSNDFGAGVLIYNSEAALHHCYFTDNSADTYGGGAYVTCQLYQSIVPVFEECEFQDNFAGYGGGIYNEWVNTELNSCHFQGNSASGQGGAMYNENSSFRMSHCTLVSNTGSAIYNFHNLGTSQPRVFDCLFATNSAPMATNGGAIFNNYADTDIQNCTITENHATNGGGIYNYNTASPAVVNCIIWGNTSVSGDAQIHDDAGCDSDVSYSAVDQAVYEGVNGNIRANPLFVTSYPYGNYFLSSVSGGQGSDSPCIDAGTGTADYWELGLRRTNTMNYNDGGVVDMGYHYERILLR